MFQQTDWNKIVMTSVVVDYNGIILGVNLLQFHMGILGKYKALDIFVWGFW